MRERRGREDGPGVRYRSFTKKREEDDVSRSVTQKCGVTAGQERASLRTAPFQEEATKIRRGEPGG